MEFPGFLGNDQLKASLSAAVDRQRAAHFYLLSGPSGAGKRTLARLLAAALLCRTHTGGLAAGAAHAGRYLPVPIPISSP